MRRPDHWVPMKLDPNNEEQMDLFNDEYTIACKFLGIPRDQMAVTFEQAATYLGVTLRTAIRYAYAKPAVLDIEHVTDADGRIRARVALDSAVEYKMRHMFRRRRP